MAVAIVGLPKLAQFRILLVGARRVVRTLQFNGKQDKAKAKPSRVTPPMRALQASNLRCPRNGQRTTAFTGITSHLHATERLEQAFGKAVRTAPLARIPANKVDRCFPSAFP